MKAPTERDPARRYKLYWVGPAWFESHAEPMGLGPEEMAEARALIKAYPRNGHYVAFSPDGIAWQRRPVREPFIPCGPAGTFDAGTVCSAGDHPVVIADEVRFYYAGVSYTRGYTEPVQSPNRYSGIGLATLSVDRCGSPAASCT